VQFKKKEIKGTVNYSCGCMGEEVLHALWTKISLRNDKQRLTLNFTVQKKTKKKKLRS